MRIRVKKMHGRRTIRLEAGGDIKEIIFNEDLLKSKKDTVSIFFRGDLSSGIINLNHEDIDKIYNSINEKRKTIKEVKIIKNGK